MNKIIGFCLAVLVLTFCLCGCQKEKVENVGENATSVETTVEEKNTDEALYEKIIREIDDAYLEEQKKSENCTTVGMIELADKYTEKWKQVADEYYNKIMEYDGIFQPNENYYSSDDLHTFVSNMKINWEQYNQVQCENYVKTLRTIYGSGTVVGPIFADYKYEMQKEWALQLVGIYEQLYIE